MNRSGLISFKVKYFPGGWNRTVTKAIKFSQTTPIVNEHYQKGLICLDENSLSVKDVERIHSQCKQAQLRPMFWQYSLEAVVLTILNPNQEYKDRDTKKYKKLLCREYLHNKPVVNKSFFSNYISRDKLDEACSKIKELRMLIDIFRNN